MLRARWTKLSLRNAPCARSSHKLSAIAGKAYLFGGEAIARNSIDSTLHVCTDDGDSWKWQALLPESAPPARVGHAQAVLGSKLYVFGGRAGVEMGESELGDLWAFDADGGSWEELRAPNVPSPRSFHAATSANGRLYVFGGCGADGRMADLHAYDAAANRWTALPSPPADVVGRGGATLEAAAGGDALWRAGGFAGHETNDLLRFDLRAEVWERVPSDWLRPRSVVASLSLPRALLLFGGEVSPSDRGHEGAGGFAADLVAVDPAGGAPLDVAVDGPPAWAPPARGWAAAAALSPTRGLLFGGLAGSDAAPERLGDAWLLDVE